MFGLSWGCEVLWVYNISKGYEEDGMIKIFVVGDQEWKQAGNRGLLTAGPNQRAVIYERQLLIVDWDYSKDSVKIQYVNLGKFVVFGIILREGRSSYFWCFNKVKCQNYLYRST